MVTKYSPSLLLIELERCTRKKDLGTVSLTQWKLMTVSLIALDLSLIQLSKGGLLVQEVLRNRGLWHVPRERNSGAGLQQ